MRQGNVFEHWGNRVLRDAKAPQVVESRDVSTVIILDDYLAADSDTVAHLLLFYRAPTHNCIARAAAEARKAIAFRDQMVADYGGCDVMMQSVKCRIERPAENLLESLVFSEEAKLPNPIRERSPLSEAFSRRSPHYELDLQTRLLRTPISRRQSAPAIDATQQRAIS